MGAIGRVMLEWLRGKQVLVIGPLPPPLTDKLTFPFYCIKIELKFH